MGEIVSSLWIGRALSALEQLSIESFLQNGYEYHLYCYDKIDGVPRGANVRDGVEILPRSEIFCYKDGPGKGSVAAFSNLFRYKLLRDRGGWWMDADMICLRPLNFDAPMVFASERTRGKTQVTGSAMKIPRGHAIAQKLYDAARREQGAREVWGTIGPKLVDRIVREERLESFVAPSETFCPWSFGDWEKMIRARSVDELITPESRTIHLWHEAWRRHGLKLNGSGRLLPVDQNLFQKIFSKSKPNAVLAELLAKYGLKK
ncbi:MAG TPA: glycosyltransferase [Verrucomicrobiae bacterium]|nr:glycosyltransferase [Verrucomicrobiae bacterium]